MKDPNNFYQHQLKIHQQSVERLNKQMYVLSMLRLTVFLLTVAGVYFFFENLPLAGVIFLVGTALFGLLLLKYMRTKRKRNLHKALVGINEEELEIGKGKFHHRDQGMRFNDALHEYAYDIDLFGKGSFFQFLNRTRLEEGSETLAHLLKANDVENIVSKQQAIQELDKKAEWRQEFSAIASLIKVEVPANQILKWLKEHQSFVPAMMRWFPTVFGLGSVALVVWSAYDYSHLTFLGYWLMLGLGITGKYLKKINVLASNSDKVKETFRQYALLLNKIENESFSSEMLLAKQQQIQSHQEKASAIFSQFSKHLDALDNRNNMIGAIFGNGLFLTDLKNSYKIEKWIRQYHQTVAHWFEAVTFFDAYNSLGNFAFNHPSYVYPEIVDNRSCIKAESLGHPLLPAQKRVDSDLEINQEQFFIVTGANMAGKSTFLRTVSLHIVMANMGLPVCAKSSQYHPVKLITSMRTSDSLTDDSSYFFSELTRLKFIVDAIKEQPYFIILDEILKGTNSTDKAIGSKKFVEKLVASDATGIIATHDLSLCEIEKDLEPVKNYYFDAQIINEELFFDYKLKKGICQNMNASFLLKKMEIV
ncbi:DNA mismatch repair protein MutS [Mangrovimonas sp. ST2L15]|uniref:MutS-related protein n=1 Tax=Mangrovimonas sp. ST2L15 TaxID=1645916 RepID=UPI0006B3FF5D|nr:DNA mismatch repair protein MutS [Mangrovimonas sp. ST2L15]